MKHAMILAAGRGERMRPLTDHAPKPLLPAGGKPLIEYHLERLAAAGYEHIVINTHHLAEQIERHLGNGEQYGLQIDYSREHPKALETGGGIFQALPMLGSEIFCVVNGDIYCEHPLHAPDLEKDILAHLILVENPPHHPEGDFGLEGNQVRIDTQPQWTFSGIGWYRPQLFAHCTPGRFPLAPLLREAIQQGQVSGEHYVGRWMDIGTPARLARLERYLQQSLSTEGP